MPIAESARGMTLPLRDAGDRTGWWQIPPFLSELWWWLRRSRVYGRGR